MGAINSIYQLSRLYRRLFWEPARMEALRRQKLRELLTHCHRNIPYYRQLFHQIGAQPEDFRNLEDLKSFPILEKETLRDRIGEFLDQRSDRRDLIPYRSSGSTGIPLELWYHPAERGRMGHTVTRELLFSGLKPWHRLVNVTEPRHAGTKNRWYHRLGLMNERFLSVYRDSRLNLQQLQEINPQVIIGFPSVLMLMGRRIQDDGATLRPSRLFTLAEVLTGEDRLLLSQQWGVEPIDLYGANEVGHIAFQCSARKAYHINVDSLHVEILQGSEPAEGGDLGEVVVTQLDLRAMPIIRYRIGDVAQKLVGACSCGCHFPLLGAIAGRSDGFVVGEKGQYFSALELTLLLKGVPGVKQYRLIQDTAGAITVEWVAADSDLASGLHPAQEMLRLLRSRLGEAQVIKLNQVAEIAKERSGKIRSVISQVKNPFRE